MSMIKLVYRLYVCILLVYLIIVVKYLILGMNWISGFYIADIRAIRNSVFNRIFSQVSCIRPIIQQDIRRQAWYLKSNLDHLEN